MNIINRIKNILIMPKTEWSAIETENTTHEKVFKTYVIPLALIPAIAVFIGLGVIGYSVLGMRVSSIDWGVRQAVVRYISMLGGTYITAFVIDALAGYFGTTRNFDRSFSLAAHAYTPMFIGGIFYLFPMLHWLAWLTGMYGLYLLYAGLQPMMKTPEEKQNAYYVTILIASVTIAVILSYVLTTIFMQGTHVGIRP